MSAGRWLVAMVATALLGWGSGAVTGADDLASSPGYQLTVTALLALGLFGSTSAIRLPIARSDLSTILFAITVGVLVKAALIMGAMACVVSQRYAVLGLVVAQIDPLSVAAMLGRSGMSDRAKNILHAWSSFDDPVTTLLTIYALGWLVPVPSGTGPAGSGLLTYAGGLGLNAVFALAAFVLWRLLRYCGDRWSGPWWPAVTMLVLTGLVVVAVTQVLMLGLAVTGLFFRPKLDRVLPPMLNTALLAATFALGLLLTGGLSPGPGAALALFAWLSQIVAALILPARLTRTDRSYLALGQQNGITAIILSLALEPALPGTVAIVAPAILFINLLHLGTNAYLNARASAQ